MSRSQLRQKLPKLPKRKLSLRRRKKAKQEIWYYNEGQLEQERICPEKWMRLIYENPVAGTPLMWLVKRKAISLIYGLYCRTRMSAKAIPKFIKQYDVDMTGCEGTYKNFAQFFAREKQDIIFPSEKNILGSPCDGLVHIHSDIDPQQVILAKGSHFSLEELFADKNLAAEFAGGTMVSIRLTPAHYHRMHFFDNGTVTSTRMIKGDLYSVSPLALSRVVRLYCRNKRALIQFSSENFGDIVIVEVGATFVGSIVHCFNEGDAVKRGQVASYFKPGGSLVLMFLKKDVFTPNAEMIKSTTEGFETKISVGQPIGGNN